jgi:hypothetical protein
LGSHVGTDHALSAGRLAPGLERADRVGRVEPGAAAARHHGRAQALIEYMRGRGTRRITTDEIMKLTRG